MVGFFPAPMLFILFVSAVVLAACMVSIWFDRFPAFPAFSEVV